MKKLNFTPLLALALLAACADNAPKVVQNTPYAGTKMSLDVQTITLVDRSGVQPSDSPYNTNHFQPTIADSIRQWASSHLQATGTSGEAIVIIKDASLSSQPIPYARDFFTRQQASKYTGHAEVEIDVKGRGNDYALANADATRYETLPENPTDLEKQNAYTVVLNGLMHDMGDNLDMSIREHMQGYVSGTGTSPRR